MNKTYTHLRPDLDAICSAWVARSFLLRDSQIIFVNANWDGEGMKPGDMAVDIEAGGRGVKGKRGLDGHVHSAFRTLAEQYLSDEDREALAPLIRFVDETDMYGAVVRRFLPDAPNHVVGMFNGTNLIAVLEALRTSCKGDDAALCDAMFSILNGMLANGRARIRARKSADECWRTGCGRVAIMENMPHAVADVLFGRGVRVIVYVDGNNIGIYRGKKETVRMDDPRIRKVVDDAGELSEWFIHSSGFLFCRGSRKAPVAAPSLVVPRDLALAAAEVL